jgi:hypothetical protein
MSHTYAFVYRQVSLTRTWKLQLAESRQGLKIFHALHKALSALLEIAKWRHKRGVQRNHQVTPILAVLFVLTKEY